MTCRGSGGKKKNENSSDSEQESEHDSDDFSDVDGEVEPDAEQFDLDDEDLNAALDDAALALTMDFDEGAEGLLNGDGLKELLSEDEEEGDADEVRRL